MLRHVVLFLFLVDTLYSKNELSKFLFTKYSTDTKFEIAFKAWKSLFF